MARKLTNRQGSSNRQIKTQAAALEQSTEKAASHLPLQKPCILHKAFPQGRRPAVVSLLWRGSGVGVGGAGARPPESPKQQQDVGWGDPEADPHLRELLIGGVDRSACCRRTRWPCKAEDPPSIMLCVHTVQSRYSWQFCSAKCRGH